MLFSKIFKKEEQANNSLEWLRADMHSHLLPGIDDGSPDMQTSLQLIRGLQDLGFSKLITTPHIFSDMYRNTREGILEKLAAVKEAMAKENLDIELEAAAEYFLDEHVEDLLARKEPLLTMGEKMVLVEFSMAFPPQSLKNILFEMQMQGYQPIIAHPERYIYLERERPFYDELKDLGCLFQLNILSLSGHYGKSSLELAQYLIKKGYYDLAGTDLHQLRHLESLKNQAITTQLEKLLQAGRLRNPEL